MSTYDLPVEERLRNIVQRAFPDRTELARVRLTPVLRETWRDLARAAGVDTTGLARAIADQLGLELAGDLTRTDPFATRLVPERLAMETLILPLRERDGALVVAAACPLPGSDLRRVQFLADRRLEVQVAPAEAIETAIARNYAQAAENRAGAIGTITLTEHGGPARETDLDESAVVRLARTLLLQAVNERASDLHVEPFAGGGVVRVRVDGILRRIAFIPGTVRDALIRYCKANGGMDPTNDRIAQDGRMSLILGNQDFELRLSVLPASRGESLVVRFLDQSRIFRLAGTGFSTAALGVLRRLARHASGVIVVTGPTGSGKSSTLYALLAEINRIGVKVVSIENPVEYRIPGISQVEVNPKAGLTFASALRSVLRQDPDIILVGEIRDAETAEVAMQAALTGHLVFTTLHTNDALAAIPRLLDLGIQPSVLADALVGVVAQRLLRRLCEHCRTPARAPWQLDEQMFLDVSGERQTSRAVGCDHCGSSGYHGRFPVAEIVEMTPELQIVIGQGERNLSRLREIARGPLAVLAGGAANRVISGDTTTREVVRVLGQRFWTDTARLFGRPVPPGVTAAVFDDAAVDEGLSVLLYQHQAGAKGNALREALEATHIRVHVAGEPDEARQLLNRNDTIGMLVVDLDAGDEAASIEVLRRMRVSVAWTRLPALLVVSPDHHELHRLLAEHGVTDYLVKPVDAPTVAARLQAILAR